MGSLWVEIIFFFKCCQDLISGQLGHIWSSKSRPWLVFSNFQPSRPPTNSPEMIGMYSFVKNWHCNCSPTRGVGTWNMRQWIQGQKLGQKCPWGILANFSSRQSSEPKTSKKGHYLKYFQKMALFWGFGLITLSRWKVSQNSLGAFLT